MNKEKPRPRPPKDAADYDIPYQPPKPAESYKVVFTKAVAVRDGPSLSAKVVAARVPGEFVMVAEVRDGWARIEKDHRGPLKVDELWMLIDGCDTPRSSPRLSPPPVAACRRPTNPPAIRPPSIRHLPATAHTPACRQPPAATPACRCLPSLSPVPSLVRTWTQRGAHPEVRVRMLSLRQDSPRLRQADRAGAVAVQGRGKAGQDW